MNLEIETRIGLIERTEKLFNTKFEDVTYPSGTNVETLMETKWINSNDLLTMLWRKDLSSERIVNLLIIEIEKANTKGTKKMNKWKEERGYKYRFFKEDCLEICRRDSDKPSVLITLGGLVADYMDLEDEIRSDI